MVRSPLPDWFRLFERATRAVNRAFAAGASAGIVGIVGLVLFAVVSRSSGAPILWPYDIAQFTLTYVFFLGLAPALESGHHVVVELFDQLVPRPLRPYVLQIAATLTAAFGCVLLWQLWRSTSRAFGDDRLAVAAISVHLKWIYVVGPIGTTQFILTAIAELGRARWGADVPARAEPSH